MANQEIWHKSPMSEQPEEGYLKGKQGRLHKCYLIQQLCVC
jgi:hypothetical protein